ncbi:hypothetical protein K438DRAFT_2018586 [Mycena galopus ATCC 62051]|nr:hypothetical protein K438DRAFT_2018586 [Mycena galopus ATCC 62051]
MRPVALGWNQLPDLNGDDSNYLVLRAPPDFKLSIWENYLDRVLIGSLQVPEGKSLAAIYANRVPEAQVLTVGLWSSNASPNLLIGSLQVPKGKSLPAIYANRVPEAQVLTVGLWSSNASPNLLIGSLQVPKGKSLPAIYANRVPEAQVLTVGLWSSNASPNSNNSATAASAPSTAYAEFAIVPRILPCRRLREIMTTVVTSMNEQPTFDPPLHSRHLRFDYLLHLLTRPFTRCNQFTSPSTICDVRVSSGADKGDMRVGSSADKGDVQMSRIKRDGVPVGGANRGVGWARDGHGMGAQRAPARRLQCERTGASIDLTRHMGATPSQRHCAVVSPSRDGICGRVAACESITFIYPT